MQWVTFAQNSESKMKTNLQLFICAVLIATFCSCSSPKGGVVITNEEGRMRTDLTFLASDALEGRAVGSQGEWKAGQYIAAKFKLMNLQAKGDSSWFQKFTFVPHAPAQVHHTGDSASLGMALVKEIHGRNVIAFLDNKASSTVIIGAHYDHLGMGDENSLWTGPKAIHNGADDNASGIAAMIELAQWLSSKPSGTTGHNYVFIAFSGEEKGLWGSNFFTKNPTVDLKSVSYMLNMDMVGHLNAEKALAVNGVGTSPEWMKILPEIKVDAIKIVTSESGVGPSDHTSFYLVDLPVLHFFTGQHEDYHKPTDDVEKVNFKGLVSVVQFMQQVILKLDSKGKLEFTKTKDATPASADFKVTLGVIPDYLYSGKGLRIDGAKDGKPGFKAGLQKGDVIMKLGDFDVEDIYGYMEALGKFEKGQKTTCIVDRNGESVTLEVVWE
jgi:hypothetical protein